MGKDTPEPREIHIEGEIEKMLVVGELHHYYHRPAGYQPGRLLIHEECKGESRDDSVLPAKNAALDENRLEFPPRLPNASNNTLEFPSVAGFCHGWHNEQREWV